ncbi:hypothetical protein OH773_00755 [Buttiauxella sp. WJP83]|uniref:hypothetical protein n=1 Tax=Buttiauxella sp. WJP83 TaxID=2986951 RepID=UPI0022DD8D12|nr:hypothetical protein [Buttiauxella sp. WJP83]WBM70831.1 hypothetical protein OH773_00755 [Buttiauxella sp. WJP83]
MLNKRFHFILINIFIFSMIISFPSMSSSLTVLKYNYGRRESLDNSKYMPGTIYLIDDRIYPWVFIGAYSPTSDIENRSIKNKQNISLDLSVKQIDGDVLATVNIFNHGKESFFIKNLSFPYTHTHEDGSTTSDLSWPSVIINTDNIMLHFFGNTCCGGISEDQRDWTEIKPDKVNSFTTVLNDSFDFLTDKRRYEIVTSNYVMVKENWFTERSIWQSLFPILNMTIAQVCPVTRKVFYVYKEGRICESNFNTYTGVRKLLDRVGINGRNKDNELSIRSEPVTIEIDGSKVRSLFTRPPYNGKS